MSRFKFLKSRRDLGLMFLAVWLILYGLVQAIGLSFWGIQIVLGVLAIAAGVLILLNR